MIVDQSNLEEMNERVNLPKKALPLIAVAICVVGLVCGRDTTVTCNCNYPGGTTTSPGGTCPGTTSSPTDCVILGGWSEWTAWTPCTASCNGGLQMRERTCDTPEPGPGCPLCAGNDLGVRVCNPQQCPPQPTVNHIHDEEFIGFSVGNRHAFSSSTGAIALIPMEVVFYNPGGYFKADNAFHAPVRGVYSFTFSGTSARGKNMFLYLYTQKPGKAKVYVATAFDYPSGSNGNVGASSSVMVVMEVGETASVWLAGGSTYQLWGMGVTTSGPATLFSGKLEKKL